MAKTIKDRSLKDFGLLMMINCDVIPDNTRAMVMNLLLSESRVSAALLIANTELSANIDEVGENILNNCMHHGLPEDILIDVVYRLTEEANHICLN
jgi:hypothetical protein